MNVNQQSSVNRKIVGAAFILFLGNVIGFAVSFFKEILVAAKYGVGYEMDAFYAASSLPNLISGTVLSIFSAIFIPILIEYKLEQREEVQKMLNGLLTFILAALLALMIILYFLSPWIISHFFPGFSGAVRSLAVTLSQLLLLMVLFSCVTGIFTSILHTEKHFTVPAFSGLAVTLATIAAILLFREKLGIFALAWGLVFGTLIQVLILLPVLKRKRYQFNFRLYRNNPMLKQTPTLLLFMLGMVIAEMNTVVGRMMSSGLQPGSIAALGYSLKLVGVPMLFFSSSIVTAVFPFFASQVAEEKTEEMKESLATSLRMVGYLAIPITVLLCVLAQPLIYLIYERGQFTAQATSLTAMVFSMYCLQLFFYTGFLLLSRVFLAMKKVVFVSIIAGISLVLNVLLNLLFMYLINPPVAGIALATSLVYMIVFFIAFVYLQKRYIRLPVGYIFNGLLEITAISLLMGLIVYLMRWWLAGVMPTTFILAVAGLTGLSVFTIFAHVAGIIEQKKIFLLLKEKLTFLKD